ncbi:MAG: DUF3793 family protein [Treponema sp.]|nr:DUF3793 family protein [Treponema sp.]
MPVEIKQVIINHCGPVLMGYKPAALFMLRSENAYGCLSGLLPASLELMVLRKSEGGLLVLFFEKEKLEETLLNKNIRTVLAGIGYPMDTSVFGFLGYLKKQFEYEHFPHEVGLFLGYPADDVLGFVKHKGRNYKLCGYWKVYGDVERAKASFRQYDKCRERIKAIFQ